MHLVSFLRDRFLVSLIQNAIFTTSVCAHLSIFFFQSRVIFIKISILVFFFFLGHSQECVIFSLDKR